MWTIASAMTLLAVGAKSRNYNIDAETITEIAKRFSDKKMLLGEEGSMAPATIEEILNEVK